jgi:hypothetical protein
MVNTSPQHDAWIARARAVPIEDELADSGINNLRREGKELVGPCPHCDSRRTCANCLNCTDLAFSDPLEKPLC